MDASAALKHFFAFFHITSHISKSRHYLCRPRSLETTGCAFVTGGGKQRSNFFFNYVSSSPRYSMSYPLITHVKASGIGQACCLAFAKEGAKGLVVADINLEGAQKTAAQAKALAVKPNFRVEAVKVDITAADSVKAAIAHAVDTLGRIDYGVHSAGVNYYPDVHIKLWKTPS